MPRTALSLRPRRALAGTATVAAAVLLTGCAELSQQTTTLKYDAADGTSAQVGPVQLNDVLLVSGPGGGTARLHGSADNRSGAPVEMTVARAGSETETKLTVPAQTEVRLDGQTSGNSTATVSPVSMTGLTAKPGESVTLTFTTSNSGAVTVNVPVLLDQPPYGSASVTHAPAATPTEHGEEGGEAGGGH